MQTVSTEKATLYDLEQRFGLLQVEDEGFFREWQTDLQPLSETEQQRLERVRLAYENLARRSLLENTVKLNEGDLGVVLQVMKRLAGLVGAA
ncbi:hypothetical protein BST81_00660 [Leptolyngbya sp. 'hensonii']|uniref:hypothetical protein n=1 Tax=Leptolyngbya sp. 'hensonii' TaxID=1922337 RepID=UPI00094F97A1|nr:hypothetical protein [Leptolyngbya sp. 'hensonii']OLP20285.1 hypothetical protein BST81_00660 [Leptolyngbya sp. 'hensonii']